MQARLDGTEADMADVARIADILGGSTAVGAEVTLRGGVRTRRDSKAGLSFIIKTATGSVGRYGRVL